MRHALVGKLWLLTHPDFEARGSTISDAEWIEKGVSGGRALIALSLVDFESGRGEMPTARR